VYTPPSLLPGYQCHPCHNLQEDQLFAVAPWQSGLITIGVVKPPSEPLAYTSNDGQIWQVVRGLSSSSDATPVGVTSAGNRTVLVGNEHNGATAWAFDGNTWQQSPEQDSLHVDYAAGGMNAVTTFDGSFIGGGFADDPLNLKSYAAVWRSTDGLTWTRDADTAGVFNGGRIWAMATKGDTVVALGTNGDVLYGQVGAWYWTQATGWQKAQIKPDDGGAIAAVVATSTGFVAVGKNAKDLGASVWTSPDGKVWTAVADQPAFHYDLQPLRMQSITSTPSGFLVGGWRSDVAKGSAVLWRSTDGLTWSDPEWQTTFSGGESTGVGVIAGTAVLVGRTGYPDWNTATIWNRAWPY